MKQLLFLSLAAVISAIQGPMEAYAVEQETQNVDPLFALVLSKEIQGTLQKHQEEFETKFSNMQSICAESNNAKPDLELLPQEWESKMEQLVDKFVDQLLRFTKGAVETVEKQMNESLDTTLSQIDLKLANVNGDIGDLKILMSGLVTQGQIEDLQERLTGLAKDAVDSIELALSNLTTSENLHVHNQNMEEQLNKISEQVESVTKCGNTDTADFVIDQLQEFSEILQNTSSTTQQCSLTYNGFADELRDLKETMQRNMIAMSGLNVSLETMRNSFATGLDEVEDVVQSINEVLTSKIENATTETTTTAATPVSVPFNSANPPPCLDSNFLGAGRGLNVCNAAVRFRKCHLTFIAIHCCRSCRDAGLISSVPIFSGSRDIPVLQALKSIKPN